MRIFFILSVLMFFSCNEKQDSKKNPKNLADIQIEEFEERIKNASLEIEKQIPEDSIYNFINITLKNNETYNFCECFVIGKNIISLNSDEEFLKSLESQINIENEKQFITNQFLYSMNFTWDETKIQNKRIIKLDEDFYREKENRKKWQKLRNEYNCCTTNISMPIFFNNFNNCIINISYSCGPLCAEGAYFIYGRGEDGKWEINKKYNVWVS